MRIKLGGMVKSYPSNWQQRVGVLMQNQRFDDALRLCRRVCDADKRNFHAWFALGAVLGMMGENEQAIRYCKKTIKLNPAFPPAYFNLARGLQGVGDHEGAEQAFRKALKLQPAYSQAAHMLGNLYRETMRHDLATLQFRSALEMSGPNPLLLFDYGNALKAQGHINEAVTEFRAALVLDASYQEAQQNIMACMNYSSSFSPLEIYQEHVRWGGSFVSHRSNEMRSVAPAPDRPLRLGYVSRDFREHSVAYFVLPLIAGHDRSAFEIYCYSDVAEPDALTRRFQTLASVWRETAGLDDEQFLEQVRTDRIDVLVDLAGHTQGNRLGVFAHRAAPVQVTMVGYPNTTGLPEMDYRFTDAWADPVGIADDMHTETLVRLPAGFLCYQAPDDTPDVGPLPARKNGHITFGSFNNITKCTPQVIELWSRILNRVPGSRLVMKSNWLEDGSTCDRYYQLFASYGINATRVDMMGWLVDTQQHISLYDRIDIGLDTFPYTGTTTTCEALWMGVPVVTLAGTSHAGRVGVSLLSQTGLQTLVAGSEQQYVELACGLACDVVRLEQIRADLRNQLLNSTLCDRQRYVAEVESAFRDMVSQKLTEKQA